MSLSFRLATRFLFHATKRRTLTLFSGVSILGIALSVFVFLLIDSIVAGLSLKLRDTLVGFEAPVVVTGWLDGVLLDLPVLHTEQFDGLISASHAGPFGVKARSVDEDFFKLKKDDLDVFWLPGFDETIFSHARAAVLLGESLYEKMGVVAYEVDSVLVTHPFGDVGPTGELEPQQQKLTVAGIFRTGRYDFDNAFVLVPTGVMASFSHEFIEKLTYVFPFNISDSAQAKLAIIEKYPKLEGKVMTWFEKNQKIFTAMNLEKILYYTIFVFILSVSCFNLGALVAIFALAKMRDSTVLRILGLQTKEIKNIFAHMGLLLGTLGTVLGLIIGILLIFILQHSSLELPEAYGFTDLPLHLRASTVICLGIAGPLFCSLVAIFPVLRLVHSDLTTVLLSSP